jgi:hypothetical protein
MRRCAAMALVLLLGAVVSAQDNKPFESKTGKFKAVFPEAPTTSTKKVEDGELNIASATFKGGAFMVIYTDLNTEQLKDIKPKEILTGGEKGFIESLKAKVTTTKDIEFGKQKFPARQIEGEAFLAEEGSRLNIRLTLILAENRLYQVFVFGPKDLPKGKEADKFFESFEIAK